MSRGGPACGSRPRIQGSERVTLSAQRRTCAPTTRDLAPLGRRGSSPRLPVLLQVDLQGVVYPDWWTTRGWSLLDRPPAATRGSLWGVVQLREDVGGDRFVTTSCCCSRVPVGRPVPRLVDEGGRLLDRAAAAARGSLWGVVQLREDVGGDRVRDDLLLLLEGPCGASRTPTGGRGWSSS
jgi:hypothetical protein